MGEEWGEVSSTHSSCPLFPAACQALRQLNPWQRLRGGEVSCQGGKIFFIKNMYNTFHRAHTGRSGVLRESVPQGKYKFYHFDLKQRKKTCLVTLPILHGWARQIRVSSVRRWLLVMTQMPTVCALNLITAKPLEILHHCVKKICSVFKVWVFARN